MGIICKIAWKTIGRYGKASLLMLCIGFLFVLTTANAYSQLDEELSSSYILSGSVSGQAELEKHAVDHKVYRRGQHMASPPPPDLPIAPPYALLPFISPQNLSCALILLVNSAGNPENLFTFLHFFFIIKLVC